jgi:hypothetical protein
LGFASVSVQIQVWLINTDQMRGRRRQNQEHLPNGRSFRLRRVTWKSTPSNQGCLLLVGFLLRRNTLTPTTLRGPAPNGHPCPDGALAASMRLGPLRVVCVRPAPKSRLAVFGLSMYENQKQIKSFPAKAGPTMSSCSPFSLPLPLLLLLLFKRKRFKHRKTRLGCRPSAGFAQWAEPHGCGESAVRTWMSVRRGPTEQDRSEGIPTKEEPSQEQAPLVTWGAFPSNSPQAKRLPLGRPL